MAKELESRTFFLFLTASLEPYPYGGFFLLFDNNQIKYLPIINYWKLIFFLDFRFQLGYSVDLCAKLYLTSKVLPLMPLSTV